MSPYFANIFLLLATIIGAGIFSLPAALKDAGSIYFIVFMLGLSVVLVYINRFYYEIVQSVRQKHQLPGYAKLILGEESARIATILLLFSTLGALLAYLIIGGNFTGNLIGVAPGTGSMIFYAAIFFLMVSAGKKIFLFDMAFVAIKVALLLIVMILSFVHGDWMYSSVPLVGAHPLHVYGAILFSLTGVSIIPELKANAHVHRSITVAQAIVAALYLCFSVILYPYLSDGTMAIRNTFFDMMGVFTVLTPYLMLTWVGCDLMEKDFKFSKQISLFAMLLIPLVLYIAGLQSFMKVVSLTGGVFLGGIAFMITTMYQKKFPQKHPIIVRVIQVVFGLGIIIEIWQFLRV